MVFSTFAVFLPAWYVTQSFGNHGLWFAFMLFFASRGIGMHVVYKKF
jgi:MATE family multidrug resistance protein